MTAPHASISVDPTRLADSARSLEEAAADTRRAQARIGSLGAVPAGVEGAARASAHAAVQNATSVLPSQAATIEQLAQQLRTTSTRARKIFEDTKYGRQGLSLALGIKDWSDDKVEHAAAREKALQRGRQLGLRGRDLNLHTARAVRREFGGAAMTRGERDVLARARRQGGPAPTGLRERLAERRDVRQSPKKSFRVTKTLAGGDPSKRAGKVGAASTALSIGSTLNDDNLSAAQKRRAVANTVITNGITKGLTKVVPGPGWVVGGGIMAIDAVTGGGATKTISKGVDVGIRGVEAAGKGAASVGKEAVGLLKKIPSPF